MLDLSAASPELNDSAGAFPTDSWRKPGAEHNLVDNVHTHPTLQPFSQVELHALAFPGDSQLCFQLEDEFEEFQAAPQVALKFPPMHAFHRRLVSDCAIRHGLTTRSMGSGLDRHVVVVKPDAKAAPTAPLLQYHLALPTSMNREKATAALGYKRRKSNAAVEQVTIDGNSVACRSVVGCESYKAFHASRQDADRSDWMKLVYQTVRKGLPLATHAHLVEVRITSPRADTGQYAELQKFLGPFQVRWLNDNRASGVGVVVYPSVPAANNCLDRFEDEDDQGHEPLPKNPLPYRLYPFAPHIFGPYVDDQALRRFKSGEGTPGSASLPMGRSPSSQGGSWRDGAGISMMERHVNNNSGRWNSSATPPLAPRDGVHGTSPPVHGGKGGWSPQVRGDGMKHHPSPGSGPYRSPGGPQPLNLGKGRWQESRGGHGRGSAHHDPNDGHTEKIVEKPVMSMVQ